MRADKNRKRGHMKSGILIALVVLILVFLVLFAIIPFSIYRNHISRFKSYQAEKCDSSLSSSTWRIEMSREEYLKLKEELLSDGWIDSTEFIAENGMDDLSTAYFSEEERKGQKEKLTLTYRFLPKFIVKPLLIYEKMIVVISDNKVYIQFGAFMTTADGLKQ